MRTVDHEDFPLLLLSKLLAGCGDAGGVIVGALGASAEDDEAVLVTACLGDCRETLLGHAEEMMGVGGCANGVDGHAYVSIGAVLISNGEAKARCKLTVELGFRCASANGSKRDEVSEILGRDGVEHFAGDWDTQAVQIGVEFPRNSEALVDLVGFVNVGVVDETLPADGCSGLL